MATKKDLEIYKVGMAMLEASHKRQISRLSHLQTKFYQLTHSRSTRKK